MKNLKKNKHIHNIHTVTILYLSSGFILLGNNEWSGHVLWVFNRAIMFSDYLEDWVASRSSGEGYKENICCKQIPFALAPSIPSFFLELFFHWYPVVYWVPTDLGSPSFSVLTFCLFILFMGLSRQEYWSDLPFHSPVDHILSDLSTLTWPSWVAPHGLA